MTTSSKASSASSSTSFLRGGESPFDFAPYATQDTDLLEQLKFLPGLKEILMLRQVHALEHATVWVLSELSKTRATATASQDWAVGSAVGSAVDNKGLGGMSTDRGFYLYGPTNGQDLRQGVGIALARLTGGEWELAVHPRCGTNLSVGMMLAGGLTLGISFLLPKGPIEQLVGAGIATTAAIALAPDLGSIAQKYATTAIPFNLAIAEIVETEDIWGRPTHFVGVRWIE